MELNLFIAVVVNAMKSQVTEDLKDEGEAHTQLILDEVRALQRELAALRAEVPVLRELLQERASQTHRPRMGVR